MRVRTNFCWGELGPCLRHSSAERSWMVDQLLTSATQMLSVGARFTVRRLTRPAPPTSNHTQQLISDTLYPFSEVRFEGDSEVAPLSIVRFHLAVFRCPQSQAFPASQIYSFFLCRMRLLNVLVVL